MLKRMWRKMNPPGLSVKWLCNLAQALQKTVWSFLEKLKIELPYDPAMPLLGIHPEKMKTNLKATCTQCSSQHTLIAKTWKQPRCPTTDDWVSMYVCTHTHTHTHTHTEYWP